MLSQELQLEIESLCTSNALMIDFNTEFPITVTVSKDMQINILEKLPEEACLRFTFDIDQIDFDMIGKFNIDEKLFTKLSTKIKKWHYVYLQEVYAQKANRLKNGVIPMWTTIKGDTVALVKKWYEG